MKVIVGLGNPGIKYINNRHNVGHMVIDELQRLKLKDKVLKSDKYMNNSGLFIKKLSEKYPKMLVSDLYIIHDDLDIPLGSFKIQFGKGPKVHNGLNDIYEKIDTSEFWHVRVGVDNRDPENRVNGYDYVLEDFTNEEKIILEKVIKQICNQLVN
ncbi:MAG: aminoacyl-tRNA hydrolase [Patescibacteria group bacterium]